MNSTIWIWQAMASISIFCFMTGWNRVEGRSQVYLETNEVINKLEGRSSLPMLPNCGTNSVCGYLQANSKGINDQPICSCPISNCPMTWDPYDGHSITQGSDQYKFCGKAPTLAPCEPLMTAYSSRTIYSKSTEQKKAQMDHILCTCPETHNYDVAGQPRFGDVDKDSEMIDVSYICSPLPACGPMDVCKFISETTETFMVNRKCYCSSSLRCPTLSETGTTESVTMGSGVIHSVRCQH